MYFFSRLSDLLVKATLTSRVFACSITAKECNLIGTHPGQIQIPTNLQ